MKALNPTILTAALLASSGLAQAAGTGWYGAVSLGSATSDGSAIHEGSHAPNTPGYGIDDAAVGGFAIGYQLANGLRVEGELRHREFDAGGTRSGKGVRSGETFDLNASARATTLMANLAYDFTTSNPALVPYVKAGIGVARTSTSADLDIQPTFTTFGLTSRWQYPDGDDEKLAWAIGGGAAYKLSARVALTADYQYIHFGDARSGWDINGDRVSLDELAAHEITLGLRYRF